MWVCMSVSVCECVGVDEYDAAHEIKQKDLYMIHT